MDFKLGMSNGSSTGLQLVDNDLVLITDYAESVGQRLFIRLKTQIGKWFINTNYGVDYFGSIFGKNRSKVLVDSIIKNEILKDRNVDYIDSFSSNISSQRIYSCSFKLKLFDLDELSTFKILTTEYGFAIITDGKVIFV